MNSKNLDPEMQVKVLQETIDTIRRDLNLTHLQIGICMHKAIDKVVAENE